LLELVLKEINTFIHHGHIQLIKSKRHL